MRSKTAQHRRRLATGLITGVLASTALSAETDEAPQAYRIAVDATVAALPMPLRTFFQAHAPALSHAAESPETIGPEPHAGTTTDDPHFVPLDIAARDGADDGDDRARSAARFPHRESVARAQQEARHVAKVGTLPWEAHRQFTALQAAFRRGRRDEIMRRAGGVIHFAVDAAMPFATTVLRDHLVGVAASGGAKPGAVPRTLRQWLQTAMLIPLTDRLAYEVRVSPDRYAPLDQPIEMIFTVVSASRLEAERLAGGGASLSQDGVCAILESRLESAALLAAGLIGTAWQNAGRPDLTDGDEAEESGGFVGSRGSMIFHRSACSSAHRIKTENRVFFQTIDEAEQAGRTPCKRCRPSGSD